MWVAGDLQQVMRQESNVRVYKQVLRQWESYARGLTFILSSMIQINQSRYRVIFSAERILQPMFL